MLIYLAGPLFSEAERRFNRRLTGRLEGLGFRVFLPRRDGVEREEPPYSAMSPEERHQATFHLDTTKMCRAWPRLADKLLVGLQTEGRAAFLGSKLNPMVRVPLQYVCDDEEALLRVLNEHGTRVEG